MRAVFVSLIIAAGLATAAEAQDQAPSPAAPAAAPAPAAPAAAAPAPAAPPAEQPTLPTSGDGAAVLSLIQKVCVPSVHGQDLDQVAKAAGLKQNRRDGTWTMSLGGQYAIIVQPQYSQKDVCQAEVHYAIGQDGPIVKALNTWAFLHQPELVLQANYVNVDPDGVKRIRKSWEHADATSSIAVNFSVMRNPNDTPLNARYDTGMLFYQERKF